MRAGDVFEVTFAGRSVAVRASKGMEDLIALLATPERDVHCLYLAGAGVRESDLGETLDAAARRRLEDRLRELQGEIDEASSFGNHARLERAQTEFDAIVDHLTAALGLDGRARRTGGTAERARSTVTQRVRGAIRRLGEVHPELGRHLEASIRTGVYCSYRPEHPVRWRV